MKKPTNLFKRAAIALMAASIVAATPAVASAAWETSGKGWNWIVNGQKATGWQWIDSQWYFMDSTGTMKTGWVQEGGSWYYLAPSGEMKTGWAQVDGTWYYLKSSGAMATGWVSWNGNWYRMNTSGAMITGWTSWNGGWYYMAPAGDMATGVIKVDGATYAMDASGKMQTGEVTVEGKTYTFGEDGAAVGDAPEATRTFVTGPSGATESTGTGSGTGGTTTPEKPSRPSTGGGGSVTPPEKPEKPDPKPPVVEEVTEPQVIASLEDWTAFKAAMKTSNFTGGVTINLTGDTVTDEINLSDLKTSSLTITSLPDNKTNVTVSSKCEDVTVNTGCTVSSADKLTNVTVGADGVTVEASVGALETGNDVTVNGATDIITVTGAAAIDGTGDIGTIAAGANNVTVSANADKVTATTGVITVDGGTVTAIESAATEITVTSGTVGSIYATNTTGVTVALPAGDTTTEVYGDTSKVTVTVGGDEVPNRVTAMAAAPVEGVDYSVEAAKAANPTKITLKVGTDGGKKTIEYQIDGGTWTTLEADVLVNVTSTLSVRTPADGDAIASLPVEIKIEASLKFTGTSTEKATEGKYFIDSAEATNGWHTVTETGGSARTIHTSGGIVSTSKWIEGEVKTQDCYVDENGDLDVTFDPAKVKVTNGSLTVTGALDGTGVSNASLYVLEEKEPVEFTEAKYIAAAANTSFTVYAGVTVDDQVKLSTKTATVVKPLPQAELAAGSIEAETASGTDPEHVTLKFADSYDPNPVPEFQYRPAVDGEDKRGEDEGYTDLTFTDKKAKVLPGKYQVRVKASNTNSASDFIEVTATGYTGFGAETYADIYYKKGVAQKNAWIEHETKKYHTDATGKIEKGEWRTETTEGKNVEHFLDATSGAVSVTFDASAVNFEGDTPATGLSGTAAATAKLYYNAGTAAAPDWKPFDSATAEAGKYTLYAGVEVGTETKVLKTSTTASEEFEIPLKTPENGTEFTFTNAAGATKATIKLNDAVDASTGLTYSVVEWDKTNSKPVEGKTPVALATEAQDLEEGTYVVAVSKAGCTTRYSESFTANAATPSQG